MSRYRARSPFHGLELCGFDLGFIECEVSMAPHEKAQHGLALINEAILETLANHPEGLQNAQIAEQLGLRSDYKGANKDYLSWSVLGLLFNAGKVERQGRRYKVAQN